MRRRSPILVLLALLLLPLALPAQVKETKKFDRPMQLTRDGGELMVSAEFPEVFSDRLRHRLASGFTSQILVEVVLKPERVKTPLAHAEVQFTILYDLWEERFNVREEKLGSRQESQLKTMDDLVASCGRIERLALNQLLDLPQATPARLEIRITVNPTSPGQRKKIREYLANPDGRSHIGSPRSFFGSFSRIFINEKDIQADAVYVYRSPNLPLPAAIPPSP